MWFSFSFFLFDCLITLIGYCVANLAILPHFEDKRNAWFLKGLFSHFFLLFKDFPVFLFFTVCPVCLFVCLLLFFSSKNLNFQVFSYTGFLQILENLENLEKSTNVIKVREKSAIFFILKAVCIYFFSFLRMINFFLAYFLYVYLIEKGCFKALFYLY